MMNMPDNEIVVVDIAGTEARVACSGEACLEIIERLGFRFDGRFYVKEVVNNKDRQSLVKTLIDENALFAAGKDWSPEEIVDMYKDQGVISKQYRLIAWNGPHSYSIYIK